MFLTSGKKIKTTMSNIDDNFNSILIDFIDKLENKEEFDHELYSYLLEYSINEEEFAKMVEAIKIFSYEDEDKHEVNFPYEDWIDRITTKTSLQ